MLGRVAELRRYPVKSMQGERLDASAIGERGLLGDRALALYDVETGKIASAKSPRMWPNLLALSATFVEPPQPDTPLPPVRITFPDGDEVRTDDPDVEDVLSDAVGRRVRLVSSNPEGAAYEYYVPDVEGADPHGTDVYFDFPNDPFGTGSLHDVSPIHLVTTATLGRLGELYPEGRFDVRRFRPNIVVETDEEGFVENDWLKRELDVAGITLRVTFPMQRCVMTTLPQDDLPRDLGILRTAAEHNRLDVLELGRYPCVGVAALVRGSGTIRCGDPVGFSGG